MTGKVHKMLTNTRMFGYIVIACRRVLFEVVGKLVCPISLASALRLDVKACTYLRQEFVSYLLPVNR